MPVMASHMPKIEVLSGPERRRRWSTAVNLAIVQDSHEPDVMVNRCSTAWHSAEPVVRLAQVGGARCADGDGIAGRGRAGIRIQSASEPSKSAAAPTRQKGDGRRNPQRSV